LSRFGQIPQHLVRICIPYDGSRGNEDNHIFPILAGFIVSTSTTPIPASEMPLMTKRGQRVQGCGHLEDNITPLSTVTPIRTPAGNVLFTPEMDDTIPPPPRSHKDAYFIKKHSSLLDLDR
jgi:hypothetical protein